MRHVAVPAIVLTDGESAEFWRACTAEKHVLFCSTESFVRQLRLRVSKRLDVCNNAPLSTSASLHVSAVALYCRRIYRYGSALLSVYCVSPF